MSVVAIIPARGGSKQIPGKNIKRICGRPLIAWCIDAAMSASLVDEVVVSTDADDIAEVAREYGADVVMRPDELAGDLVPSEEALIHAVEAVSGKQSGRPDIVVFLQCTAPLILPEDIDGTIRLVADGEHDSAMTGTPFHYFVWKHDSSESMTGVNHQESTRMMRQERVPEFLEIGACYVMRTQGLLDVRHRFFGRIGMHVISSRRAIEIDDEDDWAIAEIALAQQVKARLRRRPGHGASLAGVRAVVTDFDGVLTDNRVAIDASGDESVTCCRSDGWGIRLLKQAGYAVACISSETNPVVKHRCEKLEIPCMTGQLEKAEALSEYVKANGFELNQIAYIGNDSNDEPCLRMAGVAIVPSDARPELHVEADIVTDAAGGQGVLREVARLLIDGGDE